MKKGLSEGEATKQLKDRNLWLKFEDTVPEGHVLWQAGADQLGAPLHHLEPDSRWRTAVRTQENCAGFIDYRP